MKARGLVILGVVAVAALAAALWSSGTRAPVQDDAPSQALVPGLEAKLNDVSTLRVRAPGEAVLVTLVRNESGWGVQERGGYPADVEKLRAWLLKLAQARRVEEKTANPALYFRLGVEPMSTAEAVGVQVELDGVAPPLRLILGHNVPRGAGTYVRFADEAQSWEANADLAIERTPAGWLQRDLVDIPASRVQSIDVRPLDGGVVKIEKSQPGGGSEFRLANVPKGREPASEFVADGLAGFLSGLHFDDLGEGEPPAKTQTTVFTLDEGQALTITSWSADGKTLARLSLAKPDDVLSPRFANRTFVLPPYKADSLSKGLEGYLKPKA